MLWQPLSNKIPDPCPSQVMEQLLHLHAFIGRYPGFLEVPYRLSLPMEDQISLTFL
jgi:hypothetical protein